MRERSKFLLDALGLFDQHLQDAILGPLRVEEVMAIDIGVGLQLAVDATVALLHTPWVPGNVEMEKVPAMGLQVEALARRIGGDQNPQRMLLRICIKGFFDGLALRGRGRAVIDRDALLGSV